MGMFILMLRLLHGGGAVYGNPGFGQEISHTMGPKTGEWGCHVSGGVGCHFKVL